MRSRVPRRLLASLVVLSACARDPNPRDATPALADLGACCSVDGGADGAPATTAAVTTSSLMTTGFGSLATVALGDHGVTGDIDGTLDYDTVVRAMGGKIYVLNRTPGLLRIYDPANGFRHPISVATGNADAPADKADPADVYAIPGTGKLYVTLYVNDAAHAIGVIDLAFPEAGIARWIALPIAGSPRPHPFSLWACDGLVYVLVQDLDASYRSTGPGRIVVLDPGRDALAAGAAVIALAGTDPADIAANGDDCHRVLIAHSGDFYAPDLAHGGGGIERVDLAARKSLGMVLTASDFKGSPYTVSTRDAHLAYSILNLPANAQGLLTSKVVAFDPSSGRVLRDVTSTALFMSFAVVSPTTHELYVGISRQLDNVLPAPGLYAAAADGMPLSAPRIDLGQAPYAIAFY